MITKVPKKIEIVALFERRSDFNRDPHGYEILFDRKVVAVFGDDYHDKGGCKASGFLEGIEAVLGKMPAPTYSNKVKKMGAA